MSTKVITGKVRFSYPYLFKPQEALGGGDPKYSVTLLIPKTDTETLGKIKAAMAEARENFCNRNGANALPAKPNHILKDGDGTKDNGDPFGPECAGHYVIKVRSKQKPVIVDEYRNNITDPSKVYGGCNGRAAINFFGYNTAGQKGISATLQSVQVLPGGEPFGSVGSASDFDDDFYKAEGLDDDFLG